jgi:tetratricopeptide (TPR) repeat protein
VVQYSVLVVIFVLAGGLGHGQQMAERFNVPFGTGVTVSVATLRVPEKAWRHFAKAKEAAEHNRLQESDRETAKALAIAPDFASAYLLRADSEVREHSFEAAIANVKEARRVEPNLMWAGVVLAGAYNGLRQYEDARQVLLHVHGAESESWQAAHERARAAIGLNDIEGALHWSEIALGVAPESFPDARLVRTNALMLAHRWNEAQRQIEVYLLLKVPQERRVEVLAVLDIVKRRAREEELQQIASR